MHGFIDQFIQFLPGPAHADISTARTGPYVKVTDIRTLCGVANCAALAVDATLTVTLLQATDRWGAGAKTLATATHTADGRDDDSPSVSAAEVATKSINVENMDHANGFVWVAVKVQASTAVAGGGVLAAASLRYGVPA